MRAGGKAACLVFLFIIISPLFAQPAPDEEPPLDEWIFFLEELFIFQGALSFEEIFSDGDFFPDEELFPDDNFTAEPPFDEEASLSEDPFLEEPLPDEESELAEDPFLDEDYFFFEAPTLIFEAPVFETRSFDDIFPNFTRLQRARALNPQGIRNHFLKDESPTIVPNPDLGIDLLERVKNTNPSHIIEALVVLPYNEKEYNLLDIYNAVGRIENIKDTPVIVNGNDYFVITESTRIAGSQNRRAIPDPSPSKTLPIAETMYLRLKESTIGNLFIRGEILVGLHGITYSMTNFLDVRYFLLPLMRAERFITIIYIEPVKEGILLYNMTGFYLPDFIADRVNLTPNINRRIQVFVNWISDSLNNQETLAAEQP